MQVIISMNAPKHRVVYHKAGCIYARRIKCENRMSISKEEAEKKRYCECKYCAGLQGEMRAHAAEIRYWKKKGMAEICYDGNADTAYVTTKLGAWKIMENRFGKYYLHHLNHFTEDMPISQIKDGEYHRQADVKPTDSFCKIIHYIIDHDKAKVIMKDDFRKLPQSTKKQKKYYKQAERKAALKQRRRIDHLFALLESEAPEMKQFSIC